MIALVDIDSLFYLACYKIDTPESVEALGLSNEDADTIIYGLAQKGEERLWDMWGAIMYDIEQDENNIHIDKIEIYVTKCSNSIRKKISPQYKSDRERNEIVDCLRNMFIFNSDAISHDTLEADDLIADRARELGEDNCLIVSMDKDLKQIGGFIYNFYRKPSIKDEYGSPIETFPRKGLSYISKTDAMKFLAKQMLQGDLGDKIQGLPRYGEKTANKIIDPIESKFGLIRAVVTEYMKVYGEDYSEPLMMNFRLLYLGAM